MWASRLGRLLSELQALSGGGVAIERGWLSRSWFVALATTLAALFLGWPKLACAHAWEKQLVLRVPVGQPAAWSMVGTEEPASACAVVAGILNGTLAALDLAGSSAVFRYRVGLAEQCSGALMDAASHCATRLIYVPGEDRLFVALRRCAAAIYTCPDPEPPPGVVDVYQASSMRRVRRFALEAGAGEGFELAGNGLFYSAGQGRLLLLDVANGEVRREARYEGSVAALALNAQRNELLVGINQGSSVRVRVVDADTLEFRREWTPPLPAGASLQDMAVSPDGEALHLVTQGPNLWLLATLSGDIRRTLELGQWWNMRLLLAPENEVVYALKFSFGFPLPEKYESVVKIDTGAGNATAAWEIENDSSRFEYRYVADLKWGPQEVLWASGFTAPAGRATAWLVELDPASLDPRRTLSFGSWRDGGMLAMLPFPCPELRPLTCDCDTDGTVTVDEVVRAVVAAMETLPTWACPMADQNGDDKVTIEELVAGVNCVLGGCS
jgi:hypothetical protein